LASFIVWLALRGTIARGSQDETDQAAGFAINRSVENSDTRCYKDVLGAYVYKGASQV